MCKIALYCVYREELGVLVQKPSYKTSMKIISSVQKKIEGWEVSYVIFIFVALICGQYNFCVLFNNSWHASAARVNALV